MYCLCEFAKELFTELNVNMPGDMEKFGSESRVVDKKNDLIETMKREDANFGYMMDNINELSQKRSDSMVSDSLIVENMVNAIKRMAYISE